MRYIFLLSILWVASAYAQPGQAPSSPKGNLWMRGVALTAYFQDNYARTKMSSDSTIVGSVLVRFQIDTAGKPGKIELTYGQNKKLNEFVIDQVQNYTQWAPALKNDRPVETIYRVSVSFPEVKVVSNSNAKDE